MKAYKGYLIDLDGTIYKGNEVIDDAPELIHLLLEKGLPYLFLTNNSSRTPEQIAKKLKGMGIPCTANDVFTSSMATAKYIKQHQPYARCYVIGEEGLKQAIEQEGLKLVNDSDCDYVVMGIDRELNYEKLAIGAIAIRNGATYISTNSDIAIPTERGLVPGNGALSSVLSVSTGIDPVFIGKPEKIIVSEALSVLGTKEEDTILVGDNYDTDIKAGIHAGIDTLMVFTGITPWEELPFLKIKPTYYVRHLNEWFQYIK